MKIEKIIFVQTFPTGMYQNQKLGMEIIIEPHDFMDGEIPQIKVAKEAFEFAKRAVSESFNSMNPQLNFDPEICAPPQTVVYSNSPIQSIDPRAQDLKEIIEDCTSLEELEKLKDEAGRLGLLSAYSSKLLTFKK